MYEIQVLALANGIKTYKLKYGHRGASQPVKNFENGKTYITAQNTGFAVKVCFSCHDVIAQKVPKAGHADKDGDSKCDTCEMIIVVEPEEPTEPDTPDIPDVPEEKPCDCDCHAGGIKAFFFNFLNFFAKLFDKSARVCKCGASH